MATIDGYHPFCLLRAAVVRSRVDGRASVFFLNSVKYEMGMRNIGEEKRQRRVQRAWPVRLLTAFCASVTTSAWSVTCSPAGLRTHLRTLLQ